MNVQVEHTDQHTAKLLVTVDAETTLKAKQNAAKRLSKQIRLPGFRPGKAPYKVVVQRVGEEALLEEAIEDMANDTYKSALEESGIEPLTMGRLLDYKPEDNGVVFTFEVPKQPEVKLGDYRDLRFDLTPEEVSDEMVTKTLESMREERAVVEDVDREAQVGDELEAEVEVKWFHEGEHDHDHDHEHEDEEEDDEETESEDSKESEDAESEEDHDDDDDDDHEHGHWHTLVDDKETKLILREAGDERDFLPGLSERLVGIKEGEEREFMLRLPDDFENTDLAAQEVEVEVEVKKVRARTLPELNDLFAQTVTNNKVETLLELRMQVRKDLEEASKNAAENKLFGEVVDKIVEQAELKYPEDLVQVYVDGILQNMDRMLQQQFGMGLEDYLRVTGRKAEELRSEHREDALKRLERELVFTELVKNEQLDISEADIDREIDKVSADFGEQAALYRQLLATPQNRASIGDQVLNQRVLRRVMDIVAGLNPEIGVDAEPEVEAAPEIGSQINLSDAGESMPLDAGEAQAESASDAETVESTENNESE